MLSTKSAVLLVVLAGLTGLAGVAQKNESPSAVNCPASISVTETVAPVNRWKSSAPAISRRLERISIYNGKDGGEEYDLAPDEHRKQGKKDIATWNLKGYRTMNIFMRCRYRDTSAVLSMDIPVVLQTCTFAAEMDPKGRPVGTPLAGCK